MLGVKFALRIVMLSAQRAARNASSAEGGGDCCHLGLASPLGQALSVGVILQQMAVGRLKSSLLHKQGIFPHILLGGHLPFLDL